MKNFMKNVDIDQIKDQMTELKDQVADLRFRKPWTRGEESSPVLFLAIGAGLAFAAITLFKNRTEVANFCSNCGASLKEKWESSNLKEELKDKAGKIMDKVKDRTQDAVQGIKGATNQERFYPT